jgi:hypothetical protein
VKKLYKKLTGKDIKSQSALREIMKIVSPTEPGFGRPFQLTSSTQTQSENSADIPTEKESSWKDRIKE